MSVRAYKIKKIEYEPTPTFNLWSDDLVVQTFENEIKWGMNEEGGGIIYIDRKAVEDAIEDETDIQALETLSHILNDCDEYGVEYYCF